MTQRFLNAADIHSAQEEMGGIAVAEGMGRDFARDPGALDGAAERAADPLLVLMMAAQPAGPGIEGGMVRGNASHRGLDLAANLQIISMLGKV